MAGFCRGCGAPTSAPGQAKSFKPEGVDCANCKRHVCKPCSREREGMALCKKCINLPIVLTAVQAAPVAPQQAVIVESEVLQENILSSPAFAEEELTVHASSVEPTGEVVIPILA